MKVKLTVEETMKVKKLVNKTLEGFLQFEALSKVRDFFEKGYEDHLVKYSIKDFALEIDIDEKFFIQLLSIMTRYCPMICSQTLSIYNTTMSFAEDLENMLEEL